jgi:hypothetical protein
MDNEQIIQLLSGMYIQSLRNYDLLALIADKLGADVITITKMHQEGQILCPDPALYIGEEDENKTQDDN